MFNTIIVLIAKYLYFLIALIAVILWWFLPKEKKIASIKILTIAAPLVYILVLISSHYFFDQRPFVVENIKSLIPHAADNGFPSDHTLISMMAAMTIFFFNKKSGLLLALLAIVVGISRVLAKLHHPLDILGSVVIASISFLIAWLISKKFNQVGRADGT